MKFTDAPDTSGDLELDYARSLAGFLNGSGEAGLVEAYALGRRALNRRISLLDFSMLHHETLDALSRGGEAPSPSVAGQFFAEALSPYEVTLRAYDENIRLLGLGDALTQKNAEIERSRQQLRTILDATTAVIYLRDTDARFLFVNQRFEEVFGVSQEAILGTRGSEVLTPHVDVVLRAGDDQALRSGNLQEIEETLVLGDGEHVYLSLKVPLLDGNKNAYAVCSVATDISERIRATEAIRVAKEAADAANRALRSAQVQLVQSAKMASLGELVAGIAHEINNPLAFALSHLATARKNLNGIEPHIGGLLAGDALEGWERAGSRLREMSVGLERIRELVHKLRTFSRLDEGELKTVDVRESIDSVLAILHHRLRGRIRVDVQVGKPETIECYPSLLNQALLNLIANAIEAIENEGTISIDAGSRNDAYCIQVTDTGCGIPAEFRDRILEPFFTTKPVGQGTGLGLSITYSIVQKHGGTLTVQSPPEGGTSFLVTLPST